jgi:hypothetical protein
MALSPLALELLFIERKLVVIVESYIDTSFVKETMNVKEKKCERRNLEDTAD